MEPNYYAFLLAVCHDLPAGAAIQEATDYFRLPRRFMRYGYRRRPKPKPPLEPRITRRALRPIDTDHLPIPVVKALLRPPKPPDRVLPPALIPKPRRGPYTGTATGGVFRYGMPERVAFGRYVAPPEPVCPVCGKLRTGFTSRMDSQYRIIHRQRCIACEGAVPYRCVAGRQPKRSFARYHRRTTVVRPYRDDAWRDLTELPRTPLRRRLAERRRQEREQSC